MNFELTEEQQAIKTQARDLASRFDDAYWRRCDSGHEFPWEFYRAFAEAGWLGLAIPQEYGGAGLGLPEASLLWEGVAASGAAMKGASALNLTIFGRSPGCKHGTEDLRRRTLPGAGA